MLRLRGQYYKYQGKIADDIVADYKNGLLIKEIIKKYNISFGGLYGLLRRMGAR